MAGDMESFESTPLQEVVDKIAEIPMVAMRTMCDSLIRNGLTVRYDCVCTYPLHEP